MLNILEVSAYSLSRLGSPSLAILRTNAEAALNGTLTVAQKYAVGGRSFEKANMGELMVLLTKIAEAQAILSGGRIKSTYTDFR